MMATTRKTPATKAPATKKAVARSKAASDVKTDTAKTSERASLTLPLRNLKAETVGEVTLPEEIFGVPFRRHLVWEVVKQIRAREHRGTHKTKVRSEVSGSGRKPFKQKGTGRARQGGGRPPIHRHGGTVFGPQPHLYTHGVSVGEKKNALRSVLSRKVKESRLVVLEDLTLPSHRTGE